jgi:hypothetical protein
MSSERDSFAKGIFSTFAKGFLLHKLLLKVNFSPLRVKKSRSHDMGQWPVSCERNSFAKGIFSLLQRRKTALLGWSVNETSLSREEKSRSHDTGQCDTISDQIM